MQLKDIHSYQWLVTNELKVAHNDLPSISLREQEAHFNVDKESKIIYFCCSNTKWLTKLSKSNLVTVNSVVLNSENTILQIAGTMKENAITIRKGSMTLTDSRKKYLIENLVDFRAKKSKGEF